MKLTKEQLKQIIKEEIENIQQERILGSLRALQVDDIVKRADGKGKPGKVMDVIKDQGGKTKYVVRWGGIGVASTTHGRREELERKDLVLQPKKRGLRM